MCDETADISNDEQAVICMRSVDEVEGCESEAGWFVEMLEFSLFEGGFLEKRSLIFR